MRYKAEDRPSVAQIQEHPFMPQLYNRRELFAPDFMWTKVVSLSTNSEDFSRAVTVHSNDTFDAHSLHNGKKHAEVERLPRNIAPVTIEGSGDNIGIININDKEALDNLKKSRHRNFFSRMV